MGRNWNRREAKKKGLSETRCNLKCNPRKNYWGKGDLISPSIPRSILSVVDFLIPAKCHNCISRPPEIVRLVALTLQHKNGLHSQ